VGGKVMRNCLSLRRNQQILGKSNLPNGEDDAMTQRRNGDEKKEVK